MVSCFGSTRASSFAVNFSSTSSAGIVRLGYECNIAPRTPPPMAIALSEIESTYSLSPLGSTSPILIPAWVSRPERRLAGINTARFKAVELTPLGFRQIITKRIARTKSAPVGAPHEFDYRPTRATPTRGQKKPPDEFDSWAADQKIRRKL